MVNIMKYDYLIVGAGLFGAVFAHEMNKIGKKCLIIEKRDHIGGNVYTETQENINVHKYGAHIFHTNNKEKLKKLQNGFSKHIMKLRSQSKQMTRVARRDGSLQR